MDNGFVFAENLQAGWCASDTVDMRPQQLMTSEVFQTFSSTTRHTPCLVFSPCQSHWNYFDRTFDVHVKCHLRNAQFGMF